MYQGQNSPQFGWGFPMKFSSPPGLQNPQNWENSPFLETLCPLINQTVCIFINRGPMNTVSVLLLPRRRQWWRLKHDLYTFIAPHIHPDPDHVFVLASSLWDLRPLGRLRPLQELAAPVPCREGGRPRQVGLEEISRGHRQVLFSAFSSDRHLF